MPTLGQEIAPEEFMALGDRPRGRNRWDELVAQLESGRPREIIPEGDEKLRGVKVQLSSAARRLNARMRYQEADGKLYAMKEEGAAEDNGGSPRRRTRKGG